MGIYKTVLGQTGHAEQFNAAAFGEEYVGSMTPPPFSMCFRKRLDNGPSEK